MCGVEFTILELVWEELKILKILPIRLISAFFTAQDGSNYYSTFSPSNIYHIGFFCVCAFVCLFRFRFNLLTLKNPRHSMIHLLATVMDPLI